MGVTVAGHNASLMELPGAERVSNLQVAVAPAAVSSNVLEPFRCVWLQTAC